jgi:hypothetical protein
MRIKNEITRVARRVAEGVHRTARRVEDTARFLARGISDDGTDRVAESVQHAQAEDYTRRAVVVGHAAPLLNGIVALVDRATVAPGKGVANASPAGRRSSGGLYSKLASEVSKNVEANGFPPYPFRPLGPARTPLAYPPVNGAVSPTDFYAGRRRFGEALGKLDQARGRLTPSPALARRFEAFDAMTTLLGTLRLPAAA